MSGDHVLQRQAIQILHGNERLPILLTDVVNRADVWMVQRRGGLRFALETGEGLRVSSDLIGQELQRNEAMQPSILGLVDHTHAATAQLLQDAVVRNSLAEHRRNATAYEFRKSTLGAVGSPNCSFAVPLKNAPTNDSAGQG